LTGCGVGQQIPDAYEFDELNIIKRGGYYGHPNFKRAATDPRQCVWRPASSFGEEGDGYTAPMIKLSSSTDGIIEFESDHFNGQLRGDLILSKYKDGLYRVILSDDGETVNPISNPAIEMIGVGDDGLAVTQAPDGSLVDARYETRSCFTFQPDEPASTELIVKSVFPRRGGLAGGSTLLIFGANFSGSPTVTVGGRPCTGVVLRSGKKMECTLPSGSLGRADVVVTIGAASDTFEKGYRYITGMPL
jgi:IPT/TIG domain